MLRPCALVLLLSSAAVAAELPVAAGLVTVTEAASGLEEPWSLGFLPSGAVLITERAGRLRLLRPDGTLAEVAGLPEVASGNQGGLFDAIPARDFAASRQIFLTYAAPIRGGAATRLAVAELDEAGLSLGPATVLFTQNRPSGSGIHFGGRVVEAPDGSLFLTVGERGDKPAAQDPGLHNGKLIHLNRDGSIPAANPFAAGGGAPEIWSLGHRNPQGAALDLDGSIWTVEHGPQGGDEINHPAPGLNFGWPVTTHGIDYDDSPIGVGPEAPGMTPPAWHWTPSIAPSGLMIYSGRLFPEWRGDFFTGSLKFDMISRLERDGERLTEAERLFQDEFTRIRDIREAPDGSIWFLSVGEGAAWRVTPAR
jgi:glucose/arabinose dehydrogenase